MPVVFAGGSLAATPGHAVAPDPGASAVSATILRMRRAAVLDLFDRLELPVVPGQVWRFTDYDDDVGLGVERFLEAIGCNFDAIRAGDLVERTKASDVIEMLTLIGAAFDDHDQGVRQALDRAVLSGRYDEVRKAAETARVFGEIRMFADARPSTPPIALFDAFLEAVADALADPLTATQADAEDAAAGLAAFQAAFAEAGFALELHDAKVAELAACWPVEWTGGAEEAALRADTAVFAALLESLATDRAEDMTWLAAMVGELRSAADRLAVLLSKARAFAGADAHAPEPPDVVDPLEAAWTFFGLTAMADRTLDAMKRAHRAMMKRCHPDLAAAGDDADRARRETESKRVNGHEGIIKAWFRRASVSVAAA